MYFLCEILWRGWSHWTMFVLGGACFVLIGIINEFYDYDIPFAVQMVIGTFVITSLEFAAGMILNIWLKMNIWDYSEMPLNLYGQICLPYVFGWFLLTPLCILLDDYMRWYFFGEEKPRYVIF